MGLSKIQLGLNRGEGGRLTRDRVWWMGSKDPTADIPVVIGDAVPAGPLQGPCRWAHVLLRSHIQIERVGPPQRGMGRHGGRSRRRRSTETATRSCSTTIRLPDPTLAPSGSLRAWTGPRRSSVRCHCLAPR